MVISSSLSKPKILVVSRDTYFDEAGKAALENAGFQVFTAQRLLQITTACESGLSLIIFGHSLSTTEKWRAWKIARELSDAPVLEVHGDDGPVLTGATFFHSYPTSDDFLEKVQEIVVSVNPDGI